MAAFDAKAVDVVIGKLLTVADVISKTVISEYSPRVAHSTNLSKMSAAKFSLPSLECCADFLGIRLKNQDDSKLFSSKAALADRVILAIEALFPQVCEECESNYTIVFDSEETPPLTCFSCFQGSHDCSQIREKLSVPSTNRPLGFVWLCHGCKVKINPFKPAKRSRTVSVSNSISNSVSINVSHNASAANTPKHNIPATVITEADLQQRLSVTNTDREAEDQTGGTNPVKVCPRYIRTRDCPHGKYGKDLVEGEPCPLRHPKLCHKYCGNGTNSKFGCKKGKNCEFFHPRLCRDSLKHKHCPAEDCTFAHLRGTLRGPDRPRRPSSRERPRRYRDRSSSRSRPAENRAAGHANRRPRANSRAAALGTEENRAANDLHVRRPSSSSIDNNAHFLQIMGLVTAMQEDFRKEIAEMKSSLSNLSLAPSAPPKPLFNHLYPQSYPQSFPQSYPQQYY